MSILIRRAEPVERTTPVLAAIPEAHVIVAETEEGDMVGFVAVTLCLPPSDVAGSPVARVVAWHVNAHLRREGIGGALLQAAETWARAQGCTEIGGEAELTDFVSQRAFRRLGFEETARLVTFRRELDKSLAA